MKRFRLISSLMVIAILFTACQKEQFGIFSPHKKIDKILIKSNTSNILYEDWEWNAGLLTKIDRYSSNGTSVAFTEKFTYSGMKISEISTPNEKIVYHYTDDKLIKMEYFSYNTYRETYEIIYGKKYPKKINITIENSENRPAERILSPLRSIDRNLDIVQIFKSSTEAKGLPTGEIRLHWMNDNIARIDIENYAAHQYSEDPTITYNYEYDKQKTPFGGLFSYNINNIFDKSSINGSLERNNVTSVHRTVFNDNTHKYETESWTFEYNYEKKYPVSVKESHTDTRGRTYDVGTYFFQYY